MGFLRHDVKYRLVELIRRQIADVAVDGHDPGRGLKNEHIYVGAVTTNTVDYPIFAGATMPHDDTFVVVVVCQVRTQLDSGTAAEVAEATDKRCQVLLNAVNAAVSQAPTLTLDGVDVGDTRSFVITTMVGNVEGPEAEPVGEEGAWLAIAAVEIAVRTRMSNP